MLLLNKLCWDIFALDDMYFKLASIYIRLCGSYILFNTFGAILSFPYKVFYKSTQELKTGVAHGTGGRPGRGPMQFGKSRAGPHCPL